MGILYEIDRQFIMWSPYMSINYKMQILVGSAVERATWLG